MKVARRGRQSSRRKQRYSQNLRRVQLEQLEPRMLLTGLPYGAVGNDTGEYMLGDVVATVVLFESDGSIDPSTEDWNALLRDNQGNVVLDGDGKTISTSGPNLIEDTKQRIIEGLEWWEATLAKFYSENYVGMGIPQIHSLNFIYDFEYAHNPVVTGYEPIARSSNDYPLWVDDFFTEAGAVTTGDMNTDIRAFNQSQRENYGADWAFTIFVANDYNDFDHRFESGTFRRAFAFSGGRHIVSPATRPASTFAHETGHIFYALDEYITTLESYNKHRGYYNTQNLNSAGNDTEGFVQQPSLMANGSLMQTAWDDHISSESSLAMIGWQDSDRDGVFDVLDVPLTLNGTGYYDPNAGKYIFSGTSSVQTLVNVNSSGLRNDISINEVSRLVYSLDDGTTWNLVRTYNSPEVNIDVKLSLPPGQTFLLRTESLDPITGKIVATSAAFAGSTVPSSIVGPGIEGFVYDDRNDNGNWDSDERGVPGWTLQLVDEFGSPVETAEYLEADDYTDQSLLNDVLPGVTLSALGFDTEDTRLAAIGTDVASAGERVLGWLAWGTEDDWRTTWSAETSILRIDFDSPGTYLSIDAIAPVDGSFGRLEAYDTSEKLLGRVTTGPLSAGEVETLSFGVPTPQIAYVRVLSTAGNTILLDNLQVGPSAVAESGYFGAYAFSYLPPGDYHIQAVPGDGWDVGNPAAGIADVTVDVDGSMLWPNGTERPSDFAGVPDGTKSMWHNLAFSADITDDWLLSAIDALTVITDLNHNGGRLLSVENDPPSFVDVDGNGWVSPMDALLVIRKLNESVATPGGDESSALTVVAWSAGVLASGGEGEFDSGAEEAPDLAVSYVVAGSPTESLVQPIWNLPPVAANDRPVWRDRRQQWRDDTAAIDFNLLRSLRPGESVLGTDSILSPIPETGERAASAVVVSDSGSAGPTVAESADWQAPERVDRVWRDLAIRSDRWDDVVTLIAAEFAEEGDAVLTPDLPTAETGDRPS